MINRRTLLGRGALGGAAVALAPVGAQAHSPWAYPVFDSHCHLISLDTKRYPHAEQPALFDPKGPPPPGLPNARYGDFLPVPAISDVMRWMDENGVVAGAAVQKKGTYGFDNSYVLDASDVLPRRFTAVAVVDANAETAHATITKMAQDHNMAGIRLTGPVAKTGWLDSLATRRAWAAAHEQGLTVDLMAVPAGQSADLFARYADLAKSFPGARLVMNHAGWPDPNGANQGISDHMLRLNEAGNVYWKVTTINLDFLDEAHKPADAFMRQTVDSLGADRVMWGSDIGNSAGTYSLLMARMNRALSQLTADEARAVMHDTAVSAYRFGQR